jgi:antitoxin (DNA-binding transcriptional repressor) of toxin-antitoxin stability system
MTKFNIGETKAHLSALARRVKAGETLILCDRNVPFAEIRPLPKPSRAGKRQLGQLKGQCPVGKDFFSSDRSISDSFQSPLVSSSKTK